MAVTGNERGRWRALGERTIHQDAYVWLGQIEVEVPDGGRYWHDAVRLQRAAVMVLLDDQDRVLLMWRHRVVPDRWGWELPAGLVDEGEEPQEAAQRELEEETGYRAGSVEYLTTFQPTPGRVDSEHWVFIGRDARRAGEPTAVNEAAQLEWVPLARVEEFIATGQIWNAGSLVGLLYLLALGPWEDPASW